MPRKCWMFNLQIKVKVKTFRSVIVITFLFTKLLWPGDSEGGGLGLRVKLTPARLSIPHTVEASHCPFYYRKSSKEVLNTKFYSLWLTRPGIDLGSTARVADALSNRPLVGLKFHVEVKILSMPG